MDTINFKKYAVLLLLVSLFSCDTLFEDYDKRTYFKTEGVGYVYNEHTKEPVENARVSVENTFERRGIATVQPEHERFETDAQGYFRIKFLKRYHKSNVIVYTITASYDNNKLNSTLINLKVEELNGQKILNLDTLWIR